MRTRFVILTILVACSNHNASVPSADSRPAGSGSAAACTSDTQCAQPTPYCDAPIDQCVQCLSDTNCGPNRTCNMTTHACVQCGSDSQCGGQLPYCSPAGTCVQCTSDGNCMATQVCDQTSFTCVPKCGSNADCPRVRGVCDTMDDECVECLTGSDCANNALDKVCRTTTDTCVECEMDSDCPMMRPRCNPNDVCVECLTAADCGSAGSACTDGICH